MQDQGERQHGNWRAILLLGGGGACVGLAEITPLMDDIDIYRAATLYIDQHGEQAALQAAMQADELLAAGEVGRQRRMVEDHKGYRSAAIHRAGWIDALTKKSTFAEQISRSGVSWALAGPDCLR